MLDFLLLNQGVYSSPLRCKRRRTKSLELSPRSDQSGPNPNPRLGKISTRKKHRLNIPTKGNSTLKQCTLDSFLEKPLPTAVDNSIEDSQDSSNIAHLLALDTGTTETQHDSSIEEPSMHVPGPSDREPFLFNSLNEMKCIWVLDANNKPDYCKLQRLISDIRNHDSRILKSSIARIKSQMGDRNFVKQTRKNSKHADYLGDKNANDINSCSLQGELPPMPSGSKSTWNQARNAAVEAAKATNELNNLNTGVSAWSGRQAT